MKKKIYKYPTGAEIPGGAIYLSTVTQTEIQTNLGKATNPNRFDDEIWEKCWLVWHYFLVEVEGN